MAKRPAASKRLSADNLARLGAERLGELMFEMSGDDAIWKRRLRMELAAEVGAPDLAAEIDKRLTSVAASRARVSWRKRPEVIRDLRTLLHMIHDRLAALDLGLAAQRLLDWFALYPGLAARVKDPKGELLALFESAAQSLWETLDTAHESGLAAAAFTATAMARRPGDWARWLDAGGTAVGPALAAAILALLRAEGPPSGAPMRLIVLRLADLSGDVDVWLETLPTTHRHLPEIGAQIALRLLGAGRIEAARQALEAARPRPAADGRRWGARRPAPAPAAAPDWELADIAVLEAEGRMDEAQAARWAVFERDLSADALRDYLARLDDFEDVAALERAFAHAATYPRVLPALAFLMEWPALREAADLVAARSAELPATAPAMSDWARILEARHPEAAEILLRRPK